VRTLRQLVPLAIVLGLFAVATTVLLQRGMAVGVWMLAAFLLGHGLVHVMFAAPPPVTAGSPGADFAFDPGHSWLVTSGVLRTSAVRVIVLILVAITIVGYAMAAAATAGLIVPASWWPALVLGSTAASATLMIVGLSPGLALGIAIDVALVWLVIVRAWSPALVG